MIIKKRNAQPKQKTVHTEETKTKIETPKPSVAKIQESQIQQTPVAIPEPEKNIPK